MKCWEGPRWVEWSVPVIERAGSCPRIHCLTLSIPANIRVCGFLQVCDAMHRSEPPSTLDRGFSLQWLAVTQEFMKVREMRISNCCRLCSVLNETSGTITKPLRCRECHRRRGERIKSQRTGRSPFWGHAMAMFKIKPTGAANISIGSINYTQ